MLRSHALLSRRHAGGAVRALSTAAPTAGDLPRHAEVVVVGGGVIGCSVAYNLAKRGVTDVVLLERNQLTSGTRIKAHIL